MLIIALFGMALKTPLDAQERCRTLMSSRIAHHPAPIPPVIDSLRSSVAAATWNYVLERSPPGSRTGLLRGISPPDVANSPALRGLVRLATSDPSVREALSVILAEIIRGPSTGHSSEQGSVAAALYRELKLPEGAALGVIEDASEPFHSRETALSALWSGLSDQTGIRAGLMAFCDLAERQAHREIARDDSQSFGGMNKEEYSFLVSLVALLDLTTDPATRHLRDYAIEGTGFASAVQSLSSRW